MFACRPTARRVVVLCCNEQSATGRLPGAKSANPTTCGGGGGAFQASVKHARWGRARPSERRRLARASFRFGLEKRSKLRSSQRGGRACLSPVCLWRKAALVLVCCTRARARALEKSIWVRKLLVVFASDNESALAVCKSIGAPALAALTNSPPFVLCCVVLAVAWLSNLWCPPMRSFSRSSS